MTDAHRTARQEIENARQEEIYARSRANLRAERDRKGGEKVEYLGMASGMARSDSHWSRVGRLAKLFLIVTLPVFVILLAINVQS
jgi:hypothetical protein